MPSAQKTLNTGSMLESEQMRDAFDYFESVTRDPVPAQRRLEVVSDGETWTYEESSSFLEHVARGPQRIYCLVDSDTDRLEIEWIKDLRLTIKIALPSVHGVRTVLDILAPESHHSRQERLESPTVFIGHGRGSEWRRLRSFLSEDLNLEALVYEGDIRLGLYPAEVLWDMRSRVDLAILILTPDWIDQDGVRRAGENVVHETGLFQAWLGRDRAILVRDERCADFANVRGLEALTYRNGHIEDTFGEIRRVLTRHISNT